MSMKNLTNPAKITSVLLILLFISSCGVYHSGRNTQLSLVKNKYAKTSKTNEKETSSLDEAVAKDAVIKVSEQEMIASSEITTQKEAEEASESNYLLKDNTFASLNETYMDAVIKPRIYLIDAPCDKILLRNGEEITGKVLEIGTTEIKYKRCDNQEGPTISIFKKDVFMITYSNGIKDVFKEELHIQDGRKLSEKELRQKRGFSIASMILGILAMISLILVFFSPILGWFFLPLSILAIIFGAIGFYHLKYGPEDRPRGMSIVGLVLGLVSLCTMVTVMILEEIGYY